MKYIVELEKGVWIASWEGDPGRTLVEENARKFPSLRSAQNGLKRARVYRPFLKAKILTVEVNDD
jgi:hypothetical protein